VKEWAFLTAWDGGRAGLIRLPLRDIVNLTN
jgi:hypothetical protein